MVLLWLSYLDLGIPCSARVAEKVVLILQVSSREVVDAKLQLLQNNYYFYYYYYWIYYYNKYEIMQNNQKMQNYNYCRTIIITTIITITK